MNFFEMKNDMSKKFLTLIIGLLLLVQCKEPASLNALIVSDSANDINAMLKVILENSELFGVDVNKRDEPEFEQYDVVILNMQEGNWSDEAKSSFETYLRSGGGVVLLGPSISAFKDWSAGSEMFGINPVKAISKSNKAYDYQILTSNVEHPVTGGLPTRWMHGNDYMLYNTSGLSNDAEILATAKADSVFGGDNNSRPVLFAKSADEGRVFASTLGIASTIDQIKAIQCVGFITTLQRGAEWAATGVVSQEVPLDFPNAVSTHYWETLKPLTIDEILEKAATYEVGKSKKYLTDFSVRVRNSDGKAESYAGYESKILEFLDSDATIDSKKYMCRELSWLGTDKSIAVLEKLVNDKDLSESAQYALQRLRM